MMPFLQVEERGWECLSSCSISHDISLSTTWSLTTTIRWPYGMIWTICRPPTPWPFVSSFQIFWRNQILILPIILLSLLKKSVQTSPKRNSQNPVVIDNQYGTWQPSGSQNTRQSGHFCKDHWKGFLDCIHSSNTFIVADNKDDNI